MRVGVIKLAVGKISLVSAAVLLTALAGCSEAGESTKVGAVSGGAVGAGLGAIIGSQTGDAASGMVIGGLAGAGAGAAVGNALDHRDQAIASQDQALERQDRIIESQRNQIEELRRLSQDNVRFRADEPLAKGPAPVGRHIASRDLASRDHASRNIESRDIVATNPSSPVGSSYSMPLANSEPRAAFQEVPRAALPSAPTPSDSIVTEQIGSVSVESWDSEPAQPAVDAAARFNSVECRDAMTEHGMGAKASEVSDKLFHFRRALRLCPENPLFHVELGRAYSATGRADDARYEFEEALRLDSSYEPAVKELARLENKF